MALPKVDINIEGGQLGVVTPTGDGVAGLIITGIALTGLALNTPKKITSLQDAVDLGINAAYDTTNSCNAYQHIKHFYDLAGNGAELWIMISANTVRQATLADKTNATGAVKLLDAAAGKIRLLGITHDPDSGYTATFTDELEDDVISAITNAQALAEEYQSNYKPLVVLVEGRDWEGTEADTKDLRATGQANKYVGVVLGGWDNSGSAFVGLALGALAGQPVQRSIGRVKNGATKLSEAYLTDGTTIEASASELNGLHDKGYIFARAYQGRTGYYFNFDNNNVAATSDFNSLSRVRVIEKARLLAYDVLVEELNDDIDLDATTGYPDAAYIKSLQADIETKITANMLDKGEISGVECTINPKQNLLSTSNLAVTIEIVPKGVTKTITTTLRYTVSI